MSGQNHEIVPMCMQMCPISECIQREKQNLVHILETDLNNKNKKGTPNRNKMIKSYSRSAAGQNLTKSELLRPPSILAETVHHLLENVINDSRVSECVRYDFINDRLRCVKQDGVVQRLTGSQWLEILSPAVRFYVYSAFRFCDEPSKNFDPKLNKDQLMDCLLHILTNESDSYSEVAEIYAEMEAYYLILNFDLESINRAVLLNLPREIFQNTLTLILKWYTKNYLAVFRQLTNLSPLPACLFSALHLNDVRKNILQIMAFAFHCKNGIYPLSNLKTNLLYNSVEEVAAECTAYGLCVNKDSNTVQFKKIIFSREKVPQRKPQILQQKLGSISLQNLLLQNKQYINK